MLHYLKQYYSLPYLFIFEKTTFFCKQCASTFSAETDEVTCHCFISKQTKQFITIEAADIISEKDLAKLNHVIVAFTSRILELLGNQYKLNTEWRSENLGLDEFKSVSKQLSFIYIDAEKH